MMSEGTANNFVLPKFTASGPVTSTEFIINDTTTRYKFSLNGLGVTKVEYRGVTTMLKTVMEVAQDYTVLNYGPQRP